MDTVMDWHERVAQKLGALQDRADGDKRLGQELLKYLDNYKSRRDGEHVEQRGERIILHYEKRAVLGVRVKNGKFLILQDGREDDVFDDREAALDHMAEVMAKAVVAIGDAEEDDGEDED